MPGQRKVHSRPLNVVLDDSEGNRQYAHPKASLPAIGAILVGQWADDLVVGVGRLERAGEGGPRRHDLAWPAKRDSSRTRSVKWDDYATKECTA